MSPIEQHYTARELAGLLGVNEETIRRLALRGDLRSVAVGGQRRYPESAVKDYLEQGPATSARVFSLDRRRHA